ncbi:LysR substrate-binding domain-containing protein [Streptomyces sp. NPDC054841]
MLAELVESADMVVAEAAAHASDVFRFGNTEWTPPSLHNALQSALSPAEMRTETLTPAAALDAVRRGALTATLVPSTAFGEPVDTPELALSRTVVVREPIWLALPKGHPLSERTTIDASHLASLNWVRHAVDHWFHHVEKHLFAKLVHDDHEVLHNVVSHHEAMSWVRDADAAALTTPTGGTRDVSLVPISGTESVEMLMVWRSGSVARDVLRRLVRALREYYCEYARTIPRYWSWILEHPGEFTELKRFMSAPAGS